MVISNLCCDAVARKNVVPGFHHGSHLLFRMLYERMTGDGTPVELHTTLDGAQAVFIDGQDGQLYQINIKPMMAVVWQPPSDEMDPA